MGEALVRFGVFRVIPVVSLERADDAPRLADALVEGGLPCVEITFRTPAALDAIRIMAGREDIFVGAGTVLSVNQVQAAKDAGARFIVSPGFNPAVARYCVEMKIDFTPGVCTPTEVGQALEYGLNVVKFFPAEAFGGLKTLKAISAPFPEVRFIPTGGINPGNLQGYLEFSKVLACGGTWIASPEALAAGRFDEIRGNVREALEIVSRCSS